MKGISFLRRPITPNFKRPHSKPKFLRYPESNLVIPKLFLRKQAFIYMATTLGVGKPFSGMESFPLTDQTWNPSNRI